MRPSVLVRAFVALLSLFTCTSARGALQVSLVTFGPGAEVYERFGHVGIRLRDDAQGVDWFFDWGNFAFTKDFVFTFTRGNLNYWMNGVEGADEVIRFYTDENDRTVVEQTLNLSPAQAENLRTALLVNLRPANRFYRYDYYKDNCSTRARDALDVATGGQIHSALLDSTGRSFRGETRRLMAVGPLNKLCTVGCDLLGGPRIDAPLSRWDDSFIPTRLADALDTVQIRAPDGSMVPLVAERRTLHVTASPANANPQEPWNPIRWTLPFSLGCSAVLIVLAASRWTILFRLLATAWELWVVFASLFLPAFIAFTFHWASAWDENLLQFTPLALLALPALWSRRLRHRLRWVLPAAAGLSALGALITISHLTAQRNAPGVALALPLHVATLLGQRWTAATRTARRMAEDSIASERIPAT